MSLTQPTRRAFIKGGAALFGSANLLGTTAFAALDPNSFDSRVFHATHYGPFEGVVRDGKLVGLNTIMDIDARPTEMLTTGVIDRTYDKSRIDRKSVV